MLMIKLGTLGKNKSAYTRTRIGGIHTPLKASRINATCGNVDPK